MKGLSQIFQALFRPRYPPRQKSDPETKKTESEWLKMRENVFHEKMQQLQSIKKKYGLGKNEFKRADVPKALGVQAKVIFILIVMPDDFAVIANDQGISAVDMLFPDHGLFLREIPRIFQVPLDNERLIRMMTIADFKSNHYFKQLWRSLNNKYSQLQGKSIEMDRLREIFFDSGLYFDAITKKNIITIPVSSTELAPPEKPILVIEKKQLPADE